MTPAEFMQKYRSMVVRLDDGTLASADIHQYMINTSSNTRVANAQAMWQKISDKMNEEVKSDKKQGKEWQKAGNIGPLPPASREWLISQIDPSVTGGLLLAVQYGKGSPAANKVFLTLAVRYGFADTSKLSDFTDKYMGLDCSGFVSNYLVAVGMLAGSEVVNRSANSYDVLASRRMKLEDVRRFDLMVWATTNHIGIIDTAPLASVNLSYPAPVGGKPAAGPPLAITTYTCDVVESNGSRGLDKEQYTLESVDSHGVFTVKRQSGQTWKVHIINQGVTG